MRPIIFIEMSDLEAFIEEVKAREISQVREAGYHDYSGGGREARRSRFTAWDPDKAEILRIDVVFWKGHYNPGRSDEELKEIEDSYLKYIGPVMKSIEKVASIENGEYRKE